MLDIWEITKTKDMVPPSSKGNKSPSTKEKYSELPLMTSAIKKQGSETEVNGCAEALRQKFTGLFEHLKGHCD